MKYCANCSVQLGECPNCGTFWIAAPGGIPGKRYGVRLTNQAPDTTSPQRPMFLNQCPNVVEDR